MNNHLDGGYRHVLRLAWPMILSTSSVSIMHFTDRMFVAWYSQDSLAASLPAGITSFLALSFFLGATGYVSTFVAQYCGAGREHRIGPAVWQGIYFGLAAMVLMWSLYPLAEPIMNLGDHAPAVRILEVKYFRILVLGGGFVVLQAALSGFYTGRGKMYTIMAVSFAVNTVNIALNYCWIFGHFGFPAWGLVGAGWATVISQALSVLILSILFFSPANRRRFGTASHIGLDKDLFVRLLRYGVPNGLHFFVGVSAFTFFVFLVGRKGPTELATTNAVFTINHLAFMPMMGFAIATSTLVGQFLGRNRPDLAQRSTSAALRMVTVYMVMIAAVFIFFPEPLVGLFKSRQSNNDPARMLELGRALLIFVACYSLVDGLAIIYSAALKGAGDTLFILIFTAVASWSVMVLPVYLCIVHFGTGIRTAFAFIMAYVTVSAVGFYLRYRGGKWKHMRVIEPEPVQPTVVAEGPLVET
ncbi:MAG: MATE family efflux transporter [Phycisphaerae bacterium]|nr:MATE family efflux transporter [Phycisphaerae bacterium]